MKKIQLLVLALGVLFVAGCKTGKNCDCPTFGKNEQQKVQRF